MATRLKCINERVKQSEKGYTLIELLSVIIILAIIMVAVVPTVNKLIETRKRDSFFVSSKSIVRQVEYIEWNNEDLTSKRLSELSIPGISLTDYDQYNSYVLFENNEIKLNLVGAGKFVGLYACGVKKNSKNDVVGTIACPAI